MHCAHRVVQVLNECVEYLISVYWVDIRFGASIIMLVKNPKLNAIKVMFEFIY